VVLRKPIVAESRSAELFLVKVAMVCEAEEDIHNYLHFQIHISIVLELEKCLKAGGMGSSVRTAFENMCAHGQGVVSISLV
jgi:hypothetical protein